MSRADNLSILGIVATFLAGATACISMTMDTSRTIPLAAGVLDSTRGTLPGYHGATNNLVCCWNTAGNPPAFICACGVGQNGNCLTCQGMTITSGIVLQGNRSNIQPTAGSSDCTAYLQQVGQCNAQQGGCNGMPNGKSQSFQIEGVVIESRNP